MTDGNPRLFECFPQELHEVFIPWSGSRVRLTLMCRVCLLTQGFWLGILEHRPSVSAASTLEEATYVRVSVYGFSTITATV